MNPQTSKYRHQVRLEIWILLFLFITTLSVYWQVRNYKFVSYDDRIYVANNNYVQAGLTWQGVVWAFSNTITGNWHPVTWLSHMLDCQLYGTDPGRHHVVNVLFHIANTLLLFIILNKITGKLWQSSFVAAMFALHPLHVESVAWISERKDVLSTFFWMLTIWGYVKYVEHPSLYRYIQPLFFFILGILAKSMLVTLPFVLLLLDYWPLNRFRFFNLKIILEKIPFVLLSFLTSAIAIVSQQKGGALWTLGRFPLHIRVTNALFSYSEYLKKMIWPSHLAFFYPHPGTLSWDHIFSACLLLICLSIFSVLLIRRYPYFAMGWFWYLGTLLPVIGLVQVGLQGMADRYTYIPYIGLFIAIAWGIPDLLSGYQYKKYLLVIASGILLSLMTIVTWKQIQHWENSDALFQHALDVTSDNYVAHNCMGTILQGEQAFRHFYEAIRIKPGYPDGHYNLGNALAAEGKLDEAIKHYQEAIRIKPMIKEAHNNLGVVLARKGEFREAILHFQEALKIQPDDVGANNNLKKVLEKLKEHDSQE